MSRCCVALGCGVLLGLVLMPLLAFAAAELFDCALFYGDPL